MTDEPSKLVDAIDVAKATKQIVMQNIVTVSYTHLNLIYVKNFISAVDSQLLNCENHNSGTMEITTQELPKRCV